MNCWNFAREAEQKSLARMPIRPSRGLPDLSNLASRTQARLSCTRARYDRQKRKTPSRATDAAILIDQLPTRAGRLIAVDRQPPLFGLIRYFSPVARLP